MIRLPYTESLSPAAQFTSRDSDPFVVASIGDNCATTSVKWGTVEPIWDETHTLYVTSRETESLRIRVFDKGGAILNMQSDKDLGVVMVPLRSLEDGKEMELQLRGGWVRRRQHEARNSIGVLQRVAVRGTPHTLMPTVVQPAYSSALMSLSERMPFLRRWH